MMPMRVTPANRRRSGPFLLPARIVLLVSGILAIEFGTFNLLHELHAGEVDWIYTTVALVVGVVWLTAVVLALLEVRLGIFVAGAIAFVEFALIASTHFEVSAASLSTFVAKEGLPVATVAMALLSTCILVVISAAVCWSHPRGRYPRLDMLPLLIASVVGSVLVILQATDDLNRADFGSATPEDGAFAAAIFAATWLVGALWISRVRRIGALLIAAATFGVWFPFVTLHLLKGGVTVSQIASRTGVIWAAAAAGAAIIAGACFVLAIGLLAWSFIPRKRAAAPPLREPVRRGA